MPKIADLPLIPLDGEETVVLEKGGVTGRGLLSAAMQAIFGGRLGTAETKIVSLEESLQGKQASSTRLTALANVPIVKDSVIVGGEDDYRLLATSLVGRTILGGSDLEGRQALNAQVASPMGQALADLGTVAQGGMLVGDGNNHFVVLPSTVVGRTVVGGTAEQGRNALDAASAYGLYNATIGIGDVSAEVVDGGSEAHNGGVLTPPMTIAIPAGQVGNISYLRMAWPFEGAGHAGKTFRFRFRLATSVIFNRGLIYQMSVATAANPNVDRSATISSQVADTQIVVTIDYVVQGDETSIRPFAMINPAMTAPAGVSQSFRFTGLSAGVIATGNGILTAADENMSLVGQRLLSTVDENMDALRADILSQTILRPAYAETIVVKPSGGHFTTLAAAIAAISDSSERKQYRVSWFAGASLGTPDFHVPAWTSIICHDPRDDAILSFANPNNASAAAIENTSLLWIDEDQVVIEGGTWQIKNGRYAFHWETNGQRPRSQQRLIGVRALHLGNADAVNNAWVPFSQYAVGCGVSAGQIQIVDDCDLRGPGGGFSSHSPNHGQPWDEPFRILLSGSRFEATDAANRDILIKPIAFGPGEARIVGCSYDALGYFDGEWLGGNPGVDVNTAQINVHGHGNTSLTGGKLTFFNGIIYGSAAGKSYTGAIQEGPQLSSLLIKTGASPYATTLDDNTEWYIPEGFYGGVIGSTTDCGPAITAAIRAASADGKSGVLLGEKAYGVAKSGMSTADGTKGVGIVAPDMNRVTLRGRGRNSVIKRISNDDYHLFEAMRGADLGFENFAWDGSATALPGSGDEAKVCNLFSLNSGSAGSIENFLYRRMWHFDSLGYGVGAQFGNYSGVGFEYCYFDGTNWDAVDFKHRAASPGPFESEAIFFNHMKARRFGRVKSDNDQVAYDLRGAVMGGDLFAEDGGACAKAALRLRGGVTGDDNYGAQKSTIKGVHVKRNGSGYYSSNFGILVQADFAEVTGAVAEGFEHGGALGLVGVATKMQGAKLDLRSFACTYGGRVFSGVEAFELLVKSYGCQYGAYIEGDKGVIDLMGVNSAQNHLRFVGGADNNVVRSRQYIGSTPGGTGGNYRNDGAGNVGM